MKRTIISGLALTLLLTSGSLFAQRPGKTNDRPMRQYNQQFRQRADLDLSAEQQIQIDKLRLAHQKEVTLLRSEVQNLNTAYRLMIVDESVSEAKLKKQIALISEKRETLNLKRVQHQRQVRNLLTDEQKVKFDQHVISGRGQRGHKGNRGPGNRRGINPTGQRAR